MGYVYKVREVGTFWVSRGSGCVTTWRDRAASPDDWYAALSGPVVPIAHLAQGVFCLHASVVQIESMHVAFAAPGRTGKSTIAAGLVARGNELVSDDVTPINGGATSPADTTMRLWADSASHLSHDFDALERVVSWAEKRRVRVAPENSSHKRSPDVIYILQPDSRTAAPSAEFLIGADAGFAVLANLALAQVFSAEEQLHATQVSFDLASQARIRALRYRREYDRLDALLSFIERDALALA